MARTNYTLRNTNGDTRTISLYTRPDTITVSVADERHDTGVNSGVDASRKAFGTPKVYAWSAINTRYEEVV